jgi:hypothetical protein
MLGVGVVRTTRRAAGTVGAIGAIGAIVVAGGLAVTGLVAAPAAGAPGDVGLAQGFLSAGLCDGGPRYRVVLHNSTTGDAVEADVTVRRAGVRARWDFTSSASTTFADGTTVTTISDFGRARSNAKGVLHNSASTAAGKRHVMRFSLTRRADGATCRVRVRG